MEEWYLIYEGATVGPMTKEALMAYHPNPNTQVWKEGMAQWQPLFSVPELMTMLNSGTYNNYQAPNNYNPGGYNPAGMQGPPQPIYRGEPEKSKVVAGILAILLGEFGVHYFYIGKISAGIVMALINLVTCYTFWLFSLIQGIVILCMSQEEFDRKFVYTSNSFPLF